MTNHMATSILKLSAILITLLGLILLSHVICQIRTINGATFKPLPQKYIFSLLVSLWGIVLYFLSPVLGHLVSTEKK